MIATSKGPRIRIVVHDYAGHPFQVQLARTLAARGHDVLHLHAAGLQTPKGPLEHRPDDPPTFRVEGLDIGEPRQKHSFVRRLAQDRRYGSLLADRIAAFGSDVVISANSPLDAQAAVQAQAHRAGAAFVFWMQDVYSMAIAGALKRRLPGLGRILAARFVRLEQRLLRRSDGVAAITEDFVPLLVRWGVLRSRISVVENWAPLGEVTPLPKTKPWAVEHELADVPVFLYAGTLGLKHDPAVLLDLAHEIPAAKVVVISEGLGADWLRQNADAHSNLVLLSYRPFERLSEVLGSADILMAILESDAGIFSVPSKVLTYLAAGRPILAAIPAGNLAVRTIKRAGAVRSLNLATFRAFSLPRGCCWMIPSAAPSWARPAARMPRPPLTSMASQTGSKRSFAARRWFGTRRDLTSLLLPRCRRQLPDRRRPMTRRLPALELVR